MACVSVLQGIRGASPVMRSIQRISDDMLKLHRLLSQQGGLEVRDIGSYPINQAAGRGTRQ
jgi:hypothetical protein